MTLFDEIERRKTAKSDQETGDLAKLREKYKTDCIEHWRLHKDNIINYFAGCPVVHDQTIFVSYHDVHRGISPLCGIPISQEIWDQDDDRATSVDSLTYYFKALGINFTERGSSSYSTCTPNYQTENGLEVDLNSDVQV